MLALTISSAKFYLIFCCKTQPGTTEYSIYVYPKQGNYSETYVCQETLHFEICKMKDKSQFTESFFLFFLSFFLSAFFIYLFFIF